MSRNSTGKLRHFLTRRVARNLGSRSAPGMLHSTSFNAPIVTRGAYLDGDSAHSWPNSASACCRPDETGGHAQESEVATRGSRWQVQRQKRAGLPPRPKVLTRGTSTNIEAVKSGAPPDEALEQALVSSRAERQATGSAEADPRLGALSLKTDYAAFTLVEAVGQAMSSCSAHSTDRMELVLPAIDKIVDCMNNIFLGKSYAHRTATLFRSAIQDLIPQPAWVNASNVISVDTIFKVFQDGKESVTFQQLAVRNNAVASLEEIANLSSQEMQDLYSEYMNATAQLLFKDGCSPGENFQRGYGMITRLIKESAMLRVMHCMGGRTLVSFAKQKASSIPQEVLQRILATAEFTDAQIAEIWNLWYQCLRKMLHLKCQEQQLESAVQSAVQQAMLQPGPLANSALLTSASELKRNLEAQASAIFCFNSHATMRVLEPIQATRMHVAAAPYFTRFHLLFLSGLFPTLP